MAAWRTMSGSKVNRASGISNTVIIPSGEQPVAVVLALH
jgi:hypothetical protein